MRIFRALALILTSVLFFQCQRELSFIGGSDPQPALPAPITATVQGNVLDENGLPADGVNIKVGTKTATTDAKGYFRVTDAPLDKNASLVVAEKPGYFKAMRSFSATSGVNQVVIRLLPKTLAGTIDGTAGGSVTLNNGMKIALPANGVVNASGNTYTGSVNVYAAFIDPTSPEIDRIVPGSFMADDKNGGRVTLSSYGMMAVELESAGGEKLQVKNGSRATLTSPIPASLQSSAPASIAMWYVDESRGIWKEEGVGSKNGNNYVGDVSHFSFWNYDISLPSVNLSATIKNGDGDIIVHARVRVKANMPYPTQAYGYTDSLGQVSGLVPANQPLVLEVLDECDGVIYSKNISALSQHTNLGSLTISAATGSSIVTVKGRLVNCNGAPLTNGHAIIVYGNMVRYDEVDANGNFTTTFTRCSTSPVDFL
ncbi:MAG TPA: carboxypeptidase-like regulatory domain-containing protein, partial [Flavisolibacter sp.]